MAALRSRSLRSGLCGLCGHTRHLQRSRVSFPVLGSARCSNSTAARPRFLYQMVEDVERLEYYEPGGYHPIAIGNRLDERYRIVHKLGYGAYSTIWLARDEQFSKYVAVKVCTADANQHEVDILSRLNDTLPSRMGSDLVPALLDRFTIKGPNGSHRCLVTAPARCSLADTREASNCGLFQLDVARSLAAQLALTVAHIHDRGLVHGDLHLGNILLQLPSSLDALSDKQLYDKYGAPELEPVVRVDGEPLSPGVPSHVISPLWLGERCEYITLSDAKLTLSDFGVAFWPSEQARFESYTPLEIRPPEARFDPTVPLSFASDVWSLGCTIWALLAHRSLFDASFLATDDDVTAQQVDVVGRLPADWWEKWEGRPKKFDEHGGRISVEGGVWTWERLFEEWVQQPRRNKRMAALDEREAEAFANMIRSMLAFRPEQRPSARQVLEMEWMRRWALPEATNVGHLNV